MGYTLLGVVIEKVSGERYEDFMDTNLLIPLGMENSTFHFVNRIIFSHVSSKCINANQ